MSRPYRKKLNHRLIERVKCYTPEDLAELFDVGTPTVLGWISKDLKTIDTQKPYMLFGGDIISWIKKYQPSKERKADPSKTYCLKCRNKVLFSFENAWIETGKKEFEFVQSRCPTCKSLINRFGEVHIHTFKQTQKGLSGSIPSPLKQTFIKEKNNASIQLKERAGQIPLF